MKPWEAATDAPDPEVVSGPVKCGQRLLLKFATLPWLKVFSGSENAERKSYGDCVVVVTTSVTSRGFWGSIGA